MNPLLSPDDFHGILQNQSLLSLPTPVDDIIYECVQGSNGVNGVDQQEFQQQLYRDPARFMGLADEKIHVFPYKDVKPCWFRLYTDASVLTALGFIHSQQLIGHSKYGDNDVPVAVARCENEDGEDVLAKVVAILDMALIMAGGLGREDLIHHIMAELQSWNPKLRPRPQPGRPGAHTDQIHTVLPADLHSVPRLQYPLETLLRPAMLDFHRYMLQVNKPVVLHGIIEHWPAMVKWQNVGYWMTTTLQGRRLVPIELGRSYVDEDWGQRIVPFGTFLDQHILASGGEQPTGYLAQHDLLRQIRPLRADVAVPDYCYLDTPLPDLTRPVAHSTSKMQGKTSHPSTMPSMADFDQDEVHMNVWFGPAWTISPLHHDPYHNILCQVVGKKYVRLYSPWSGAKLNPRGAEPAPHLIDGEVGATIDMSNTSNIDIAAIELSPHEDWDEVYPGFSELPYLECILEAGQALYIPVGWWHYVRSISVGISVSFWWN